MPVVDPPVRNRYFFMLDMVLLPIAVYLGFVTRLDSFNLGTYWVGFALFCLLSVLITPLIFKQVGIYSRYWRYASIDELALLAGAMLTSTVVISSFALVTSTLLPMIIVPRSIPLVYMSFGSLVIAGPRLIARLLWNRHMIARRSASETSAKASRVLIVGAGSAGTMLARELRDNPQLGLDAVGFVDDDPIKRSMIIYSLPVLGCCEDISSLVHEHDISQVLIAMPTAPGKTIRAVVTQCEKVDVRARIIPAIFDLLDGKVSITQLRDVQIEDLLRRKPVRTNTTAVGDLLRGRRVMITGGGGSIGSEICRQVLRSQPAELIILGHGENSVFLIENELRKKLPADSPTRISSVIADIRFAERIQSVFARYRPEIIFHAAAHKHVPLMESNPVEAITNNVIGTRNLLNAALDVGVQQFVMISTDKAVNPTSVMGASKRIAELLVHQASRRSGMPYVAVRFGNVLGSRGSVVLTFKQQIAAGGPVTVTHPDMVRFFMTIPEAVQLTLQAATLGHGGEVFTLDMGEPVKIVDLARDMIELSGLEVGHDIDITFSGMRPGEKLYEELFIPGEDYQRTIHEKIFIARNASKLVPHSLDDQIRVFELAARHDNLPMIMRGLQSMIPTFRTDLVLMPPPLEERAVGELPLRARTVGQ
ncbi:polysaccharide biosynthesis protein [Chloroflexales bacterium ZM16-3]|nr:polysaccharide biosynthesis protein [Chloroflexales bacterium ZM16-3]